MTEDSVHSIVDESSWLCPAGGPHCVVYPTPVLHTLGSYTELLFNGACIILFTYRSEYLGARRCI